MPIKIMINQIKRYRLFYKQVACPKLPSMNKTLVWTLSESPELPTRQVTVLSSNDFINTILPLVTVSYVRAEVHLSVSTGSFRHTCVHTHTHTHAHISPQHLHTPGNKRGPAAQLLLFSF